MVHTGLTILGTVDGIAFAELDLVQLVELIGLPADEGVIIRVCIGGQESTTPINTRPEGAVVGLQHGQACRSLRDTESGRTMAMGGK